MHYFCYSIYYMRWTWWKIAAILLLFTTIVMAYLVEVPELPIIKQSIRNLYFHVCMWMCMAFLQICSAIHAIKFLRTNTITEDFKSAALANTSMLVGLLGYATGFIWASYTWSMKTNEPVFTTEIFREPKLIGTGICLLVYFGYIVFRNSITEPYQRAKLSAVYNIFAFAIMIPSIYIIPRMFESLHPGGQGSPVFGKSDLSVTMRVLFWPAALGYCLLGYWISQVLWRIQIVIFRKNFSK